MGVNRARLGQAFIGLALLLCGLAGAQRAVAGSLVLSPLRLTLSSKNPIGALNVRNDSDSAVVMQLETLQWGQENGQDAYSPTADLLATPPIFTIPPHASQLVRVGLRRAADPTRELTYRLFLQEVPPAVTAGANGLRVAMRLGVPVFVAAQALPGKAMRANLLQLKWQLRRVADRYTLIASNDTAMHVQITALALRSSVTLQVDKTPCYVLSGQIREWPLTSERRLADGESVQVSASTDAGEMQAVVIASASN